MLYENKNHHLLGDYGPHCARNLGGRCDGSRAWPNVGRFRPVRGRCNYAPWLSCVPSHDPRSVEAGWRCDLAGSGVSRLKEWAYAGIFFELTGAAASFVARGEITGDLIAPLVLTGLAVASWALRPQSRTLGVLFPANKPA